MPVFVAGSVGPTGKPLAPVGLVTPEQAQAAFKEQIEGLLEGGVDLLILETFSDLEEMRQAILAAQAACDLPIVAQMSFNDAGEIQGGAQSRAGGAGARGDGRRCCGRQLLRRPGGDLQRAPAHAPGGAGSGSRCSRMPAIPGYAGGRFVYFATPAYLADYARQFVDCRRHTDR